MGLFRHTELIKGPTTRSSPDQVMGGVSKGTMVRDAVAGRPAIRMREEH